jgi:hypothetical protein
MRYFKALIGLFVLISCNSQHDTNKINLTEQIYRQSQQILNKHNNQIWNLLSIDTTDIKIYKGCFISPKDSVLFISISGEAGGSSGNANRLNLLGHIKDSLVVDYYEQGALPDTILDFDNDGIDDFYFNIGSVWMGSCNDNYLIKNFSSKKETVLFQQHDESVLDCGWIIEESSKLGDTLSTSRSFKFQDFNNDKKYEIIRTTEYKIHNGGKIEQDIIDSLKSIVTIDTIRINKN